MKITKITSLLEIKRSIICKNISDSYIRTDINETHIPKAGDIAIFKVLEIGKHTRIQTVSGRNAFLVPNDLIMCAFGNRYATNQIEGYVPKSYLNTYDILGQGGVVGEATSIHKFIDPIGTTKIELVGYIVNQEGVVYNTIEEATPLTKFRTVRSLNQPKIILSLGTSMDSGKTSTAAFLANGLRQNNKKVAYIKLTGTVFTKDKYYVKDHGANIIADFSDFGFPSTYMCDTETILNLYQSLLIQVQEENPDYIIVEIADGLLERETKAIINHKKFKNHIYGVLFSAIDSISALMGERCLRDLGYNVLGISGLVTTSPLLVKELRANTNSPVYLQEDLMNKEIINQIEEKPLVDTNEKVENYRKVYI